MQNCYVDAVAHILDPHLDIDHDHLSMALQSAAEAAVKQDVHLN